jgi:hypothetical protein
MPFRKLTPEELKADSENPEGHYACFYKTFYPAFCSTSTSTPEMMLDQYDQYRELGLTSYLKRMNWKIQTFEQHLDRTALLDLQLVWQTKDKYEEPCGLPEMRCPKTHQRHKFSEVSTVGYSWHGPIHQATCLDCGFSWSNH